MEEKNQTSVEKEEKKVESVAPEIKKVEEKETKKKLEEVKKSVEKSLAGAVKKEIAKSKKDSKEKVPTLVREYTIPLRKKWMRTVRYKKTNKAVKAVKEFLARHMKVYDRDLNKIKLDIHLNEFIWAKGIKNPPSKVSVKAIKEEDIVRVELLAPSEKIKFKKQRLEKRSQKGLEGVSKKKTLLERARASGQATSGSESPQEKEDDKKEASEKKSAVVDAGREQARAAAKDSKHMAKDKKNQPKHPRRTALQK
ncbi:MAG: 50S ribosomal protein L31e [Nanoarchaeota archaeon]|nr:50S ribosomal protein L31e [Nanoarchaeota archaeon]